jgi:hypothetical protein
LRTATDVNTTGIETGTTGGSSVPHGANEVMSAKLGVIMPVKFGAIMLGNGGATIPPTGACRSASGGSAESGWRERDIANTATMVALPDGIMDRRRDGANPTFLLDRQRRWPRTTSTRITDVNRRTLIGNSVVLVL